MKVPSLDGEGKMSKSVNQMATLYLSDEDDSIRKKIMKAKTDGGPASNNAEKPDYIENIFLLMKLVSTQDVLESFESDYNNCNIRYGDMKKKLGEDMVQFLTPIRERTIEIMNDPSYIKDVLETGSAKAKKSAAATMEIVREAMGLQYYN